MAVAVAVVATRAAKTLADCAACAGPKTMPASAPLTTPTSATAWLYQWANVGATVEVVA